MEDVAVGSLDGKTFGNQSSWEQYRHLFANLNLLKMTLFCLHFVIFSTINGN
jgi:hypothetical protein